MAHKSDRRQSGEYFSFEEYQRAFFPRPPDDTHLEEAVDPGTFETRLAREVLKKALEGSDPQGKEGVEEQKT